MHLGPPNHILQVHSFPLRSECALMRRSRLCFWFSRSIFSELRVVSCTSVCSRTNDQRLSQPAAAAVEAADETSSGRSANINSALVCVCELA